MRATAVSLTVAAGLAATVLPVASAVAEPSLPLPPPVPPRTAASFDAPLMGIHLGTANENEPRAGLSIVKLYLADYALRRGARSPGDRALTERMIRFSDDDAADAIDREYPHAIDAIAAEYRLTHTHSPGYWGNATTSTADVSHFLQALRGREPNSPILAWMAAAAPVAADGTRQNWGTARLPGVQGTKWGWSDTGPAEVASASYGPGFTVSAQTFGTPADQNADVAGVIGRLLRDSLVRR
jgi:hypothetical protein